VTTDLADRVTAQLTRLAHDKARRTGCGCANCRRQAASLSEWVNQRVKTKEYPARPLAFTLSDPMTVKVLGLTFTGYVAAVTILPGRAVVGLLEYDPASVVSLEELAGDFINHALTRLDDDESG
jgi:hypothetical protein